MLQQTQVKTVIPYYKKWLRQFPDLGSLERSSMDRIYRLWEGLGYYSRARNLKKGAEFIVKELGGRFPRKRGELLRIPGVGPYTAGAVASIAFGEPEPLVDGNVGRVFARLFEIPGHWNESATNKKLWAKAREVMSKKRPGDFNEALMELGATVCTKADPLCGDCPVLSFCRACQNGTVSKYPAPRKTNITKVGKITLILHRGGRVLVRRKKRGVMKGLWEFPTIVARQPKGGGGRERVKAVLKRQGASVQNLRFLGRISHGYTRFRAVLHIWKGKLVKGTLNDGDFEKPEWFVLKDLHAIPFPAVYREIAEKHLRP
jgi:A/G-specific adenine glycosylase